MNVCLSNQYLGNMEWTKETLKDTCIEIKNVNQSNRILKFYQSFGYFERTKQNWECPKSMVGSFIGPSRFYSDDIVHVYWPDSVSKLQIIKLPVTPRSKFPREMMVSDDKKKWEKRLIAGKIKSTSPYVSYIKGEFQEGQVFKFLLAWKYAKEIDDRTAS